MAYLGELRDKLDPMRDSRGLHGSQHGAQHEDPWRWAVAALVLVVLSVWLTMSYGPDVAIVAGLCFILLTLPFWQGTNS